MVLVHQIIITFVKALFYGALIIAGVFAGKKYRDYKDAKKAAEAGNESGSGLGKEGKNE